MKVEIIRPDGTREPIVFASKENDGVARLAEMYRVIGCTTIEHITTKDGGHLWMDEDGKYKNLPRNDVATKILHEAGGMPFDFIGGVVILETPERRAS